MKRKCLEHEACPVARALDAIGDWWSLLIVRDAFRGVRRFGAFQKTSVWPNILTARLRKLVAVGILEVVPASDGSKYREYALMEKARGLYLVLVALRQWGRATSFAGTRSTSYWSIASAANRSAPGTPRERRPGAGPEDVRLVESRQS